MSFIFGIVNRVSSIMSGTRGKIYSDFVVDSNKHHSRRISTDAESVDNAVAANAAGNAAAMHSPARKITAATCTAALVLTGMGTAVLSCSAFPETAEAGNISRSGKSYYGGYSTSHFSIGGKTAFCMQPPKRGPYSYGSWSWATSNSKLCAAMYFGVSGPGFNYAKSHGWWPKKNWNGKAMSWNDYYACTHVLLSYIYGGKASALYGTNRTFQNWATANILGTLYKNISANAWQINPTYKKGVWIAYTGGRYQDMICAENYTYDGGFRIFKKDSATGKGMKGIKFNIYTSDKNGKKGSYVKQVTTDSSGYAYTGELELPRGYYRAYEVNPPSGYKAVWTNTVYVKGDGTRQTATAVNSKTTSFTARKNFVGTPRSGAKVTLLRNGAAYSSRILSASSQNITWTNLPYHDSKGKAYKYTVREDNVSSGYVTLGNVRYRSVQVGNTITNTETTTHTVTKTWNDLSASFSDWRYRRPSSLKVQLVRTLNGGGRTVVGNATLTASNNWSYTWRDLPRTDSSNRAYTYSAVEVPDAATSKNYTVSYSYSGTKTTITNVIAKKDISVKKQWIYKDGKKPASVSFELYVGLVKVATQSMPVSALSNTDTIVFKDLPKYDKSGNEIRYIVREIVPAGWKPISNDISTTGTASFTNVSTESIDIPVEKKWNGADVEGVSAVPESVEVKLLSNGTDTGKSIVLSEASGWKGAFTQLPRYSSMGKEIEYTVSEVEVENWNSSVTGSSANGFVITNTPVIPVKFIKKWTGGDFSNIAPAYRADIEDGIVLEISGQRQDGTTDVWNVDMTGTMNETGDTIWETSSNIPLIDETGEEYKSFDISELDDLSVLSSTDGKSSSEYYYVSTISGSIRDREVTVTNEQKNKTNINFSIDKKWDTVNGGSPQAVDVDIMRTSLKKVASGSSDSNTAVFTELEPLDLSSYMQVMHINWEGKLSTYGGISSATVEIRDCTAEGKNVATFAIEPSIWNRGAGAFAFSFTDNGLPADQVRTYQITMEAVYETGNEDNAPFEVELYSWDFSDPSTKTPESPTVLETLTLDETNSFSSSRTYESDDFDTDTFTFLYPVEHDLGKIDDGRFLPSYFVNGNVAWTPISTEAVSDIVSAIDYRQSPQYDYTITNTFAKEDIDIPVRKIWNDEENLAGIRPNSIEVKLYKHLKGKNADADRELAATAVLDEDNDWKYTFEQMKAWDALTGDIWIYEVEEEQVPQYDAPQISGSYLKGFVIENNLALTSVEVDKSWNDLDNTYDTRPDSITVHVLADGKVIENKELVLNEDNGWKGSFVGLPVYDVDGNVITYTVEEVAVDGYDSNTSYEISGGVTKVFATLDEDGNLRLYKRPMKSTQILQEGGTWNDGINTYIINKIYNQNFEMENSHTPEWYNDRSNIKTVEAVDIGIAPLSTCYWFDGAENLASVNLEKLDTSNVTNMAVMFRGCSSLTNLDVSRWDTSNVTSMTAMFRGCSSLTNLDVSRWDTSNVTSMNSMFYECSVLANIDVSRWNTASVTNMGHTFYNCSSLVSLDVSEWSTSNATSMFNMFDGCSSLVSLDVSEWDTSNATSMIAMFHGCSSLVSLDVSEWSTSNVTGMNSMFYDCSALTNLDVSRWDTSNVTSMIAMFRGCSSLTNLDVSRWDTSNVTGMFYMFRDCSSLASLDVSEWSTSNVTAMYGMFDGCSSLASLDVNRWSTSNVTEMTNMFRGCSSLSSLDVSEWSTSNVTNMNGMFYGCSSLASLNVSRFDTSNVTNMGSMFYGCKSLSSLDVSKWSTSNVTNMNGMFKACISLSSLNVSRFDTSNVTNTEYMFWNCMKLVSLDLSSFNTSKVTNMDAMFAFSYILKNIYVSNLWSTVSVTSSTDMFNRCDKLCGGAGTTYNVSHIKHTYARVDGGPSSSTPGYFTYKAAPVATAATASMSTDVSTLTARALSSNTAPKLSSSPASAATIPAASGSASASLLSLNAIALPLYDDATDSSDAITGAISALATTSAQSPVLATAAAAVAESDLTLPASGTSGDEVRWEIDENGVLTLTPTNGTSGTLETTVSWNGTIGGTSTTYSCPGWWDYRELVTSVSVSDGTTIVLPRYVSNLFAKHTQLTTGMLDGFDTSNVTYMRYMFYGCSSLESLDLSGFKTSNVTNMYMMFDGCSSLASLDVSGWDTSNVTDMYGMFDGCSSLTSLDLNKFNTSKVTNMGSMFYGCSSLVSLDLSKFNTSKVTSMNSMFWGCSSLASLNANGFDTSNVTNMSGMFYNCSALTNLNVSKFNTSKVTSMGSMFKGCSSLTNLNVSGFDTSNVTNMDSMFQNCPSLTNLNVSKFNTSKVKSMIHMFYDCSSLASLNVSGFDTSNVTNMSGMFWDCSALTSLDVSGFDTSSVTSMYYMFDGCSSLTSLDLSSFDTSKVTSMIGMFWDCSALTSLDVSGFNTSKVTTMKNMFFGCYRLSRITLSSSFAVPSTNRPVFPTPNSKYSDYKVTDKWKSDAHEDSYTSAALLSALVDAGTDTSAFAGTWEWEELPKYSISFAPNGASGTVEDVDWYIGYINEHILPDDNNLYFSGNRFMGWSTAEDGSTGLLQPGKCQQELGSDGDKITLYAIWQDLREPIPAHIVNVLKERSIEITKKWDTYSTNPPSAIIVHLSRPGALYNVVLSEANGWSAKIDHLPVFDSNGKEYSYSVYELPFNANTKNDVLGSDSYETKIEGDALNGFVLTNIEKRHIPVSKIWSDYDDADGLRPDEITIELYRMETIDSTSETSTSPDESNAAALPDAIDGYYWKKIDSINLSDANNWAHTFDDLPRYDADGMEYSYYVSEVPLAPELSYTALISGTQDTGFVVNNVHDRIYKELYVSKQWRDDDNRDKIRPSSVTVHLQQNGANYGDPIVLSDSNSWTASTGLVPIYDKNGQAYKYSFVEDAVEGYKSSINRDASNVDAYVVTNSHTPTTRSVEVEKTFFSVPAGIELTPVTVHLMQNGKRMEGDAYTAVLSKDTKWKHVFDLLPIYDENGNEYIYTVDEDRVDDYVSIMTGNQDIGFTITNYCIGGLLPDGSPEVASIAIPLTKIWEDDGNADRTRPDSVTVHLYCDYGKWNENTGEHEWKEVTSLGEGNLPMSPKTITGDDGVWKTSWTGLPAGEFVDSGNNGDYEFVEYSYKITEDPCPGYEISDAISDGSGGFVLTNTKTTETSIEKRWIGDDESQRPASIDATLMRTRYSNAAECSNLYVLYDKATRTEIERFDDLNEALDSDNTMRVYPYAINNTGSTHAMLAMDGTVSGNVHITAYASSTVENDDGTIEENTSLIGTADLTIPESDKTAKMFHDFGALSTDGEISFTVTDDTGNDIGKSVMSFMLYGDETVTEPMDKVTLSTANNWSASMTGLYAYDVRGLPQQWSLVEDDCYGYTSNFEQGEEGTLILTNTLVDHITVNKQWLDGTGTLRPDSVEVELLANGTRTGRKATLSAANNWSSEFDNIRWRDGSGNEICYTVEESVPAGYEVRIGAAASVENNYTVTVTNMPTIDIPVRKIWSGDEGHEDARPDLIEASLTARTSMTRNIDVSIDPALDDAATAYDVSSLFDDVPRMIEQMCNTYDSLSSVKLELTSVRDSDVSFYLNLLDGTVQKDKIFVELPAHSTKIVEFDAHMLSSIKNIDIESAAFAENDTGLYDIASDGDLSATLLVEGTRNAGTLTLSNENNWAAVFEGLSQTDALGNSIAYSVNEITDVPSYSSMVTGTPSEGYVIDNAYALDDIPIRKIWSDMNDKDGYRPASVKIALFEVESTDEDGEEILGSKVGEAILSDGNNWQSKFAHVKTHNDAGDDIAFTVREIDDAGNLYVPEHYTAKISGDAANGFTVTNIHEVLTSLSVEKVWDDGGNENMKRPYSIMFRIYRNSVSEENEVANSFVEGDMYEDTWTCEFGNLPYADDDGNVIDYIVTEDAISDYTTIIEKNDDGTVRVTNHTDYTQTYELPFSGSNGVAWIVLGGMGIVLLVFGAMLRREAKRVSGIYDIYR